jgi:hypothetical protein
MSKKREKNRNEQENVFVEFYFEIEFAVTGELVVMVAAGISSA